ncbi:serine kinase [Azospirillum sp.]|uniref:serine kinase n=1 Tax=Azospirillum sp. TaxID=34012 RepID=UPI002D5D22AD|nr:serine kinase [Azospirillum sp.]HYD63942.1 serine kinase [Azospirillum sp.]
MTTVHTLCGLKVVSDLPMPDLLPWTGDDRAPDVAIRLGEVPDRLDAPVIDGPLLQVGADGTCRFAVSGVAAYLVEGGHTVTVRTEMDAAAPDVRVFLLGTVFGILCAQRGLLPLHASCVAIGGRAVAFSGVSGAGKSTLAAAFHRQGYPVLADDVTVVDVEAPGGPLVLPSFPRIKLWGDVMNAFALPRKGLERSRAELDKYHVPLDGRFQAEPLPLAAIYRLEEARLPSQEGAERLNPATAVQSLEVDIYRCRTMRRLLSPARLFHLLTQIAAAAPSYRLWRRMGLGDLDAQVAALAARQGSDAGGRA